MPEHTTVAETEELLNFVKKAGECFKKSEMHSYTEDDIKPGCLFGLRWGLGEDCVMVFRLDEGFTPIVYDQVVKKGES